MKVLAIGLWVIGVGSLVVGCLPTPYWPYYLAASVVLTLAATAAAMSSTP